MTTLSSADLETLRQSAQFHRAMQRGAKAVIDPDVLLLLLDTYEDCAHVEAENERLVDELKGADFTIGELEAENDRLENELAEAVDEPSDAYVDRDEAVKP